MLRIGISDAYDGGNIEFVEIQENGVITVSLRIKQDPYTELEKMHHSQYFSFRSTVSGLKKSKENDEKDKEKKPVEVRFVIENASKVSYPEAWDGTTVFYSSNMEDSESWKRKIDTKYTADGKLTWAHEYQANGSIYFSFFPPYSYNRHLELISKCCEFGADVESLGQSLDGREIECVTIGTGPKVCWIIHRQHPGETMAEYYAEGFLSRVLGFDNKNGEVDGLVKKALQLYTFYIVPNMCPDGSVRGHLRTNAAGANLNREWATITEEYDAPTLERSPEVYYVLNKMDETGVDAFLDIHGDEELPYNFLSGAEGTPNWGDRLQALHGAFLAAYSRTNPDMQQKIGYDPHPEVDPKILNIAASQIATRFNCLSAVLEMPFKDCESNPNPNHGWSPNRSRMLGASVLEPLIYVYPYLRTDEQFWKELPAYDAYIAPTEKF